MRRGILALTLALTAGSVAGLAHQRLLAQRATFPADEDLLYLPPPTHMRAMAAGFVEALADLVWIRAVVFAGTKIGHERVDWVEDYLRVINHLAPRYRRPYAWGGVVTIYTGAEIRREQLEISTRILRAGVENFPEDHELLFALGMQLYRDFTPEYGFSEEEARAAKREAVDLIRRAAAFGAPPLIRQLAATFIANGSDEQLAVRYLEQQLLAAESESHRRLLKHKLEQLREGGSFRPVLELRAAFEDERAAQFPYLDDATYALIRDSALDQADRP